MLLKMDPGAELPDHEHVMLEQTYVIEGRLVDKEGSESGLTCGQGEIRLAARRQSALRVDARRWLDDRGFPDTQQILREGWENGRSRR